MSTVSPSNRNSFGSLDEIDVDLTFAGLARHIWGGRPGNGDQLASLIDELIAEQQRHAMMENLREKFLPIANAEHEHLALDAVDPDYVRRTILTPPEDRPGRVDGQIPTESDGL